MTEIRILEQATHEAMLTKISDAIIWYLYV